MVEAAERDGILQPGGFLVESSSGNLGVALSMIAASKGYRFVCVTDPRCNLSTRLMMEALGGQVHVVTEPDPVGGFLGARIDYVRAAVRLRRAVRVAQPVHQPEQLEGALPHAPRRRSPASSRDLDVLFVGAGTTGTLMGCARYFREWHRPVRIVAVDSVGSVTFGGAPGRRMIPGLGMSVRPPLLDESYVDEVVHVEEADTIRACHRLASRGFLFGGSTGTVVSGAMDWLAQHDARRPYRGRHRPRPRRALPRHRLPDQLAAGPLRRRRAQLDEQTAGSRSRPDPTGTRRRGARPTCQR